MYKIERLNFNFMPNKKIQEKGGWYTHQNASFCVPQKKETGTGLRRQHDIKYTRLINLDMVRS